MPNSEHARSAMMSPREWRFVRIGGAVSVIALIAVLGVVPFARHWQAREAQLNAERERYARLQALIAHKPALDSAAQTRENMLAAMPRRVVRARSRALASAALQSLLQELAEQSNVTVSRLEVGAGAVAASSSGSSIANSGGAPAGLANASAEPGAGEVLPVSMSAIGDVYGLTAFLGQLRNGPRVITVDRLSVQVNSALRGAPDVLQMTISLRAPAIVE